MALLLHLQIPHLNVFCSTPPIMLTHDLPDYVDLAWRQFLLSRSSPADANILYYTQDLKHAIYFTGAERLPAMQFVEIQLLFQGQMAARAAFPGGEPNRRAARLARYWQGVKRAIELKRPMLPEEMDRIILEKFSTPTHFRLACREVYTQVKIVITHEAYPKDTEEVFKFCIAPPSVTKTIFTQSVQGLNCQLIPKKAEEIRPKQKPGFIKEEIDEEVDRNPGEGMFYKAKEFETFLRIRYCKEPSDEAETWHVLVMSRDLQKDTIRGIFMNALHEMGYKFVYIQLDTEMDDLHDADWELYGPHSRVTCFEAELLASLKTINSEPRKFLGWEEDRDYEGDEDYETLSQLFNLE